MAIQKIANKAYRCLQSDIDIWYGTPEKGATYFCEDSGAIYIGKKYIDDEQYPLCFVLSDIINKKDRKVNPVCRSQDLKNFAGKQYMITDFYRDVLFDALPYEVKDETAGYTRVGNVIKCTATSRGVYESLRLLPGNIGKLVAMGKLTASGSNKYITLSYGGSSFKFESTSWTKHEFDVSSTAYTGELATMVETSGEIRIYQAKFLQHVDSAGANTPEYRYGALVKDSSENILDVLYNKQEFNNLTNGEFFNLKDHRYAATFAKTTGRVGIQNGGLSYKPFIATKDIICNAGLDKSSNAYYLPKGKTMDCFTAEILD